MATGVAQSFVTPNYSGVLFAKGNMDTPLLSMIGDRRVLTNHVEFVTGQEYEPFQATAQPEISETASLTAPEPEYATRSQKTNVTQIFQETVGISYAKQSNMGTLSGINIAGQEANPGDELDFQVAHTLNKVRQKLEYTFINGVYQKASSDSQANKTRGILTAITSNIKTMGSKPLGYWDIIDLMTTIDKNGGSLDDLVLACDRVTELQLNASAVENGLTVIPADRTVNGIALNKIVTPDGEFYIKRFKYLPKGVAALLNLSMIRPVEQNTPNKGNFFLEELAKVGAGTKHQIFGQAGLDHGPEWMHGKFTGIKQTFEAPKYNKTVKVINEAGAGA